MENRGSCVLMAGPGTDSADGSADGPDTLSADTARRRRSTKVGHALLSPNEEMQFARDELDRRRKLRLQQVREQQRYLAVCVRQQVERRRRQHESHLEAELRQEWRLEQQHRKNTLTHELTHTLHGVGHAHASAKENEPDWAWLAQKKAEQKERAAQRHTHALKELKMHTHTQEQQHTRHIQARRKALEVEKNRSAKVANMPTPPPDHIESVLENVSLKKGVVVEQFSSSHHHLPETTVETHTLQVDAKAAAEEEARRLDELDQEETRDRLEHLEKARLRGEHALKKEHLTQERQRMLLDLERMQAADWQRRRQALHQAPPAVSSSSHTHTHTHTLADDGQRRLEHAFQDLYTNERRVKGDLVLQLVPEPLPAPSTSSHGNDLDLTLESDVTPVEEEEEEVKEEEEEEEVEELKEAGPADMPSQSHGLQRLLERIRSQREHWNSAPTSSSLSQHPVTMATQHSDATAPMATQHSDATAPMTTQHSDATAPMATQHSSGDVAIATPLSEDDDVAMNGLSIEMGSPARTHTHNTGLREESVLSVEPEQSQEEEEVLKQDSGVQACTTEDSHILRIQQYQQQLLDQSRQHRQSVEEARRRLDEYQRTLALRHRSVTMTTTPSAVSTATSPQASAVPMATTCSAIDHSTHTHSPSCPVNHLKHLPQVLSGPAPVLSQVLSGPAPALPQVLSDPVPALSQVLSGPAPALPQVLSGPAPALSQVLSDPAPALSQVLSGPAPALSQVLLQEGSVWGVALPPPAVVLEMLRNKQQEGNSLISALLRAIQDSSESANQGASSSQLTNQGASSSQLTNLSASSPQAASHSTREASLVPPLASALVSQNSALHDWHQLSAILEVDTPLNSTVAEESMFNVEAPSSSESSSVSLPSHTHSHTHTEESLPSHTHTHARASRLSWRDTLHTLCLDPAPPITVAVPDSDARCQMPETEFLSPLDPGSFTTTISTGSYCTSSVGTDPSLCAGARSGVGVVSPFGSSLQCRKRIIAMATEHRMPDNIQLNQAEINTGLHSWAQVLQEAPGGNSSPDAESSILQSSAMFFPLQPQTDSSSSSSTHLQIRDDTVSLIAHQLSCPASGSSQSDLSLPRHASASSQSDLSLPRHASASSQSDLSLPRHASASSQSDLSLPRHASASSQSDLSLPHYASNSSQSDLSQSDLSQLIGQLSSHSSQSASGGRGLSDSACRRIGQDSREEPRGRHVIGQTSGQVAGYWLAEGRDSGTSVLIGRGPTLQPVLPDDLQQSLDSFHPLEAELTHGHLSVDSEDGPSPLRADHAHLSQQAVQDSLFQSAVSLDLLPLSDSSLHDDRSPHDDRSLPASPAHTRHLISQSEEELTANMPLWERIMVPVSGRGILEESMLSLVSESDVTVQSSFHGNEMDEGRETPHTQPQHTHTQHTQPPHTPPQHTQPPHTHPQHTQPPHTHPQHTQEALGQEEVDTHISHTHLQEGQDEGFDTHSLEKQNGGEKEITQVISSDTQDKACLQLPLHAGVCVLKRVGEVKISPEHRNRLSNQSEEVTHRQATSTINRQRAREFQQKTLQKLRAKHTHSLRNTHTHTA